MKFSKKFSSPPIARLLQLSAHPTYVLLGIIWFYGLQRPIFYYPMLIATNVCFFALFISISNRFLPRERIESLTPFIMAGTIMLNMEASDWKGLVVAGLFGVLSRSFIRTQNGHIFNPGYFGVFAVSMLLPTLGHNSLGLWKADIYFLLFIFVFGNFIVYRARRLYVSYGYLIGFSLAALAVSSLLKMSGFKLNGLEQLPLLFWPGTLISIGYCIFTFHVISDPKTSPSEPKHQFFFGMMIGVLDIFFKIFLILPGEAIAYLAVQAVRGVYINKTTQMELR